MTQLGTRVNYMIGHFGGKAAPDSAANVACKSKPGRGCSCMLRDGPPMPTAGTWPARRPRFSLRDADDHEHQADSPPRSSACVPADAAQQYRMTRDNEQ